MAFLETKTAEHNLESYIYGTREKLGDFGKAKEYAVPEEKEVLLAKLAEAESWIYGEGAGAAKELYIEKLGTLTVLGDPIMNRFKSF
jgi:hypothetical protein